MAIKINTQKTAELLVGKSHWWGAPDLPKGTPYPYVTIQDPEGDFDEPLTFICQINCEDIAEFDAEGLIPHKGMLYFFAPLDYFLGEYDSPLDYHIPPKIIYAEDCSNLEPYKICWEGTNESIFRPAEKMDFSLADHIQGDGIIMLGKPYQDEVLESHSGDICLLQIDESDDWGLRFYDCGMYYIFINPANIKNGEWNQASSELFYY